MVTFKKVDKQLRYDPKTGLLWWKVRVKGRQFEKPAGTHTEGQYCYVRLQKAHYLTHRIIWLLQTGIWPASGIDHKNGVRSDNRWRNLRLATQSQNNANMKKGVRNNSNYKGVSWRADSKKWRASVQFNHKRMYLGSFDTAEEAYAAYCKAAKKYQGAFARYE